MMMVTYKCENCGHVFRESELADKAAPLTSVPGVFTNHGGTFHQAECPECCKSTPVTAAADREAAIDAMIENDNKPYRAWAQGDLCCRTYHPPEDQCSECRAAPGKPHAPDCPAIHHDSEEGANSESSVPFAVQEFMFEELAEVQLEYLHDIIKNHERAILEIARDRWREGFTKYGDRMYHWTPAERLKNVLEELADAVVYLTSGALE